MGKQFGIKKMVSLYGMGLGLLAVCPLLALTPDAWPHWPLKEPLVEELRDRTYFFPANRTETDPTVYLSLRRWDFLFTGDRLNEPDSPVDHENVNHLIPGPFNHLMIYMGKDAQGLAWALEVNTSSFTDPGGLRFLCMGSDFGLLRHPHDKHLHERERLTRRWAQRLRPDLRRRLIASQEELLRRLAADLALGMPYQLEFRHSGNPLDPVINLVDDGFTGGAGCSDYWTTLFEEVAQVCLPGSRMSAAELETYFREDPEGRMAYAPRSISPFASDLSIRHLIGLGFHAVDPRPHRYPCTGEQETGLVLPGRIMELDSLRPIPSFGPGVDLPHWQLQP